MKTETTKMIVRKKDVKKIRELIKRLQEEDIPPKPIKRTVKFTDAQLKSICKQVRKIGVQLRAISREYDRIENFYDDRLSAKDARWVDETLIQLSGVQELANDQLG